MIQKDGYSPYNGLIREENQTPDKNVVIATTNDNNNNNSSSNHNHAWKRNAITPTAGVADARVWKRQRCSYHGEDTILNGVVLNQQHCHEEQGDMDQDMLGNAADGVAGTTTHRANDTTIQRKEPTDGICFMMAPKNACDSMAVEDDDAFDIIDPEDYYEDKWD